MKWFKKKEPEVEPTMDANHTVELVAHKDATQRAVQRAKVANSQLNRVFAENGFTVKIVLAMGAKQIKGGNRS